MTEFWVSQSKHYCKFCKVWLANNKPSIQHHEMGKKHKESVANFFKEKREARLQGAMSESELDKQLRDIERAARDQAEQDAAMFGGAGLPKAPPPPPPRLAGQKPPPPPPRRDYNVGYKQDEDDDKKAGRDDEEEEDKKDDGRYTVGDVTYLDGKMHESKMVRGMMCEVWLEAEDRWVENATIVNVREIAVPNTTMVLRKISVTYRLQPDDEDAVVEEDITTDRLRLIESVKEPQAPEPPPKDEHTGMGGWQTVAVRVVDVEQERRAAQEALVMAELERKEKDGKKRLELMQAAMEGEDAMSSYDPHGKGVYKGVDLNTQVTVTAEDLLDLGGDKDGPVAFKKRKAAGGADKKGKFRRKKGGDEDD